MRSDYDADALAAIHRASFVFPRPWSSREIDEVLTSPGAFLLTEPAGFLIGRAIAGEAELLTLAVDPSARRNGVGRRLVHAFFGSAEQRGADIAFLEVAADNAPALALYAACGFVQSGRRRNYYAGPDGALVDALLLQSPLASISTNT